MHSGGYSNFLKKIKTESQTKVYTTDVVIEEQEFAESKANSENNTNIPDGIDDELPFN